jgi:putative intracellular protease/amidase
VSVDCAGDLNHPRGEHHERSKQQFLRLSELRRLDVHLRLPEARRACDLRLWFGLRLRRRLRLRQDHECRYVIRQSVVWASALLVSALLPAQAQIAPYQARFERTRPVVAVVGENSATELIDFVIPYGILAQSGAADVLALGTRPGPMRMRPALRIEPQATLQTFDQRFPDGADYVIVPAMMFESHAAQSVVLDWLRTQAAKGATVVSICDGAIVVAQAGLFKGHRATGHWATQSKRERAFPDTQWLVNTRYVADGKVISSAGVTAAIPLSLALVEAIAGTDTATRLANDLGVSDWSSEHNSQQFRMRASTYALAIRNLVSTRRKIDLQVSAGEDEISLSLAADTYSRTFRNRVFTLAGAAGAIRTKGGLTVAARSHRSREEVIARRCHDARWTLARRGARPHSRRHYPQIWPRHRELRGLTTRVSAAGTLGCAALAIDPNHLKPRVGPVWTHRLRFISRQTQHSVAMSTPIRRHLGAIAADGLRCRTCGDAPWFGRETKACSRCPRNP